MDLEWRVAELERLFQEQGKEISALEVEAQKRQCYKDQLFWGLKQLLPLRYKSCYLTAEGRFQSSWHMWFGKVFAIKTNRQQGKEVEKLKQQTNSFGNRLIHVNLPKCRDVIAKGRPVVYVKSFPINKRPGLNFLNEVQEQCKKNSECDALTETMFQYERYRLAFYEIALQLRRWRRIALSGCVAGALLIIILIALWVKTNGMP